HLIQLTTHTPQFVHTTIEDVTQILPSGYAKGGITVSADKKRLTIDLAIKGPGRGPGREAGCDFKVSGQAKRLDVDLTQPSGPIYIGLEGAHPPAKTFSLPA